MKRLALVVSVLFAPAFASNELSFIKSELIQAIHDANAPKVEHLVLNYLRLETTNTAEIPAIMKDLAELNSIVDQLIAQSSADLHNIVHIPNGMKTAVAVASLGLSGWLLQSADQTLRQSQRPWLDRIKYEGPLFAGAAVFLGFGIRQLLSVIDNACIKQTRTNLLAIKEILRQLRIILSAHKTI